MPPAFPRPMPLTSPEPPPPEPLVSDTMAPVFRLTPSPGTGPGTGAASSADRRVERSGRFVPDRAMQDAWVTRLQAGDEGARREVVEAYSERITSVVSGFSPFR